jgi:hypothetical protein
MVTELGWIYLVAGTMLFFFWAYGIVSFVRDCKNRYVPAIGRFVRGRRRERAEAEREREREERERQLY